MGALEELVAVLDQARLAADQRLGEWFSLHAPDGDLRALWDGCERARTLLDLSRDPVDPWPAIAAAGAVARSVDALLPSGEPAFLLALDALEEWVRARAPWQVTQDAECAFRAKEALAKWRAAGAPAATILAGEACYQAALSADLAMSYDAFTAAADTAELVTAARVAAGEDPNAVESDLAALARRHLRCPTRAQLHLAFQLD